MLNDMALCELTEPIKFGQIVQPIKLLSEEVPPNRKIIISGWGRVSQGGEIPTILKWNEVESMSQEECVDSVGIYSDRLMCMGHGKDNGACNGDSGGPATFGGKLCAIATFVYGGCGTSNPDGYAKISPNIDWITEVTGISNI